MKKPKMAKHIGKTIHPHMVSHHFGGKGGKGGKDPLASAMHHEHNAAMGGPEGLSPLGGYDSEAASGSTTAGTSGNEEMC